MSKPRANDNSWLGNTATRATLQVIDEETNRWKTVGSCLDTPNAIRAELAKEQCAGQSIWVRDALGERRYHGQIGG